jgi:light-regulated signal transduction histidine kinase (bacteriophytochrome)
MDFLIYACLGLAVLAIVAGLWGRSRLLRESEGQRRQFMKELSDHRQSEDALRIRNEQLEAHIEQQTRLIAAANQELEGCFHAISHDLRSPVRAIAGFAEILRSEHGQKLDRETEQLLERIESNARRLGQQVDDLLDFAKLSGRTMLPAPVNMDSLARSVVRELTAETAGAARISVQTLPATAGDPSLLRQVWANLVGNALKFSRGAAQPEIEIGGNRMEGRCVYFVRDNGVGFDMEYSGRLFQLFQRLHGPGEFEGTGAGLAIVQRIIRRHGGLVWAEGRRGEGATFSFALPHGADPDGRALVLQRDRRSGKLRTH